MHRSWAQRANLPTVWDYSYVGPDGEVAFVGHAQEFPDGTAACWRGLGGVGLPARNLEQAKAFVEGLP